MVFSNLFNSINTYSNFIFYYEDCVFNTNLVNVQAIASMYFLIFLT